MVLVLSMISGTIIAEASVSEDVKLVKVVDTTGRNYEDYVTDLGRMWSFSYIGKNAYADDSTAMNLTYNSANNMRITVTPPDGKETSGIHTVSYKILADNDTNSDGNVDFASSSITVNRVASSSSKNDGTFGFPTLKVNRWYEFKIVFDLDAATKKSKIELRDVASDAVVATGGYNVKNDNGYTNMWMQITYQSGTQAKMLFKDMKHESDYGKTKASITSVGSDGSVAHSQNKVKFTLDRELPGLTEDHVLVKNRDGGSDITASSITVTSDATAPSDAQWIVEATLNQDLAAWSKYTVALSADYYAGYKEVSGLSYVPVTDITKDFTTPSAPLDIKAPEIETDGSATTDIVSTSGATNMTLVYTNTASEGYIKEVKTESITVEGLIDDKTIIFSDGFESGDTAKFFVIKGWDNPVPLFNKTWSERYDGTIPEVEEIKSSSKAQTKEIVLDEYEYNTNFDHTNKKIVVNLNTGNSAVTEGVLYVYSDVLSDGNIDYADYITTASDGTILKEIKFDDSILSATKEYTVAFYSSEVDGAIEETFNVYNDYVEYKRQNIFENAKKSSTFSGLKQVITGTDDMGNTINDAWTVFSGDAGVSVYNTLTDKEAVFVSLSSLVESLADYDALCDKFEELAKAQKNKENKPKPVPPASNNKNPGSPSVSMSATPAAGEKPGATVGGGSAFSDMSGHWAQKYAEALVSKGVVNGYADGSFRGDNSITRAELTKIIVEALNVPGNEGKGFADVSSSSWYASYVSRANASGVVNGFEDGCFKPEANVSRQDAVLMIYRAMNLSAKLPEGFKFFADEKDIQDYASDAIRCLGDLGIITGSDSKFLPKNNITRAEMAAVICRAIDYMESHMQ